MSAAHQQLDNLTVIIDRNRLQQGDEVANTNNLEPLADKWRAFGWAVTEIDGHDYSQLLETFNKVPLVKHQPSCIIAHTHKGKGVSFMEDNVAWHHRVPNAEEYAKAIKELEGVLV
jgi:transketolase